MNGHYLRQKLILWNAEHVAQIKRVLDTLKDLQDTKEGAFFKNSKKSERSVFGTIECLFPFLLYPFSQNYSQVIDDGIKYIVSNTKPNGVPSDSQFPANTMSLVDSTAFGIYVFTMAKNYYLEERKKKFFHLIEDRIRGWIKFIFDNKNSSGWGLLKGQISRVYSTSLVVGALSNCEDCFFDPPTLKDELLNDGIKYLCSEQKEIGGWECEDGSGTKIINPQITATAIFSLNSSLRFNFNKEVEQTINKGAEYLLTAGLDWLQPFEEKISIEIGKSITTTFFPHPYYMVLPALLMTGYMGFHDKRILDLYNMISQSLTNFQPNKAGGYNYYELSEIANALILFFSTANVARKSDLIFSSAGLCPACQRVEPLFIVKKFINYFRSFRSFLSKYPRFCLFTISSLWIITVIGGICLLNLYIDNFFKDSWTLPGLIHLFGGGIGIYYPIKKLRSYLRKIRKR